MMSLMYPRTFRTAHIVPTASRRVSDSEAVNRVICGTQGNLEPPREHSLHVLQFATAPSFRLPKSIHAMQQTGTAHAALLRAKLT